MNTLLRIAYGMDRFGFRAFIAFLASRANQLRGRHKQRFSVDGMKRWVNIQPEATIVSPSIHAGLYEQLRDTVFENWCWQYMPKAGDVVIDVGAGVGEEAVIFSKCVGNSGKVVSIEAHPETYECLLSTIERSGLPNIVALPVAVTDSVGEVRIQEQANHLANSLVLAGSDQGDLVRSTTLDSIADDLGLQQVALLKMNIEGAERLAVQGMERLSSRLSHIVVSCHDFIADNGDGGDEFRTFDEVRAKLESLGFETISRSDHSLPWVRRYIYGRNRSGI